MSNVDISYGELILIDTFDAGAGIVGAAQAAVAYARRVGDDAYEPLVAISAETFYFSNNLSIGGQIDLSGTINFNVLDVSGDATLDASLNVKGNSYLRGKLEVNEIGALEKATTGGVDTFRLANIDNISDISYALQQMKTGETAINSGNNLSLKIGGDDMLSINAAGNVGIGTTTPSKSLEVVGDISCDDLYAKTSIIQCVFQKAYSFEVSDRMYGGGFAGNWGDDDVNTSTSTENIAKYIPLARWGGHDSLRINGTMRTTGSPGVGAGLTDAATGGGPTCAKLDLFMSGRYDNEAHKLHVQGSITGIIDPSMSLVVFDVGSGNPAIFYLYLVTELNFTMYHFNIQTVGGQNSTASEYNIWPGPTNNYLDEHTIGNFTTFPAYRGSGPEGPLEAASGNGAHSLNMNVNASGIRTMYTTNTFNYNDTKAHIKVIYNHDIADDNQEVTTHITKFPGDVSCADLYSNKILTPSGNNTLYIAPNHTNTSDHRIIHLGLMGSEDIVGQLRFGRADPYGVNPWVRHHSIKVASRVGLASNNYMRFDLHNGSNGASDQGETYAAQVNVMTLLGDGNVGIGTIAPSEKLHVSGNFRVDGDVHLGIMSALEAEGEVRLGGPQATGRWHSIACYNSATEANNYMAFRLHKGNDGGYNETTKEILRLDGNGRVGIGTTTPSQALEVTGAIKSSSSLLCGGNLYSTGSYLNLENQTTDGYFRFRSNDDDIVTILATGDVGIGTRTPSEKLDVSGGNIRISNQYSSTGIQDSADLTFYTAGNTTEFPTCSITAYIKAGVNGSGGASAIGKPGGMVFRTKTAYVDDVLVDRMVINAAGNVGIGTTNPSEKLYVSGGNIYTDRGIQALGGDPLGSTDTNIAFVANNYPNIATSNCSKIVLRLDNSNFFGCEILGGLWQDAYSSQTSPENLEGSERFAINVVSQGTKTRALSILGSSDARNGNVGIGTTTPSKSLEVVGDISCQNLYANARIIETKNADYINFDVADRMYTGSNWTTGTAKYIPLASLGSSGSMNVKGILRDSDGNNSYVCKVDLMISVRYDGSYKDVHVQGTLTGKLLSDAALVLFSNTVNADGTTYHQNDAKYLLYFVTSVNFSHYDLNITGPIVASVWPGPTHSGLDEHSTTNQFTSFPQNRGVDTDLGTGAHSLDINTPASGIRTMYTTNTLYDSGDNGVHIAVIHHATDDAGDNVISKFPVDVSCADLYSNKILTPSGNNKLYIIPNSTWGQNDLVNERVIHFGLMGSDDRTGELRLGRQHSDDRYHSIKVVSDDAQLNNLMHFDLHTVAGGSTAQVNVMTLRGDGNVGIGTLNPSYPLVIDSVAVNSGNSWKSHLSILDRTAYNGNNNGGGIVFGGVYSSSADSDNNYAYWAKISGEKANTTDGDEQGQLMFYTRNSSGIAERMRIDEHGRVGILRTNPAHALDVFGNIRLSGSSSASLYLNSGGNNPTQIESNGSYLNLELTYSGGFFRFRANDGTGVDDIVRILANGNVGIGTTSPSEKLEVVGDISCESLYFELDSTSTSGWGTAGGLGGLTSFCYDLKSCMPRNQGPAGFKILVSNKKFDDGDYLAVNSDGHIRTKSGPSDDRIKFDETIVTDCMTLVNKLVPKRYNIISDEPSDASGIWMPTDASWNDVSNNFHYNNEYGFIAQEVGDISGLEMVVKGKPFDESGNQTIMSLKYNGLFTIGIGAIKELHQLILSQAATISALEARVRILENP